MNDQLRESQRRLWSESDELSVAYRQGWFAFEQRVTRPPYRCDQKRLRAAWLAGWFFHQRDSGGDGERPERLGGCKR